MAQIAYWIAHPDSAWPGTPTGPQIAAGNLSSGSPAAYAGSESAPGSGSGTITEATAATGLTASTAYRIAWVVYDDVALTYSNVVVGLETTAASLSLAIAGATHAHAADSLTLSSASALTIESAAHAHTADSLTLLSGAGLAIDGATHGHTADALALTSASTLAANDATHAHAAEGVVLTSASTLTIAGAAHAHTADNVALESAGTTLAIDGATHAHTAQALALSIQSVMAIDGATHAHTADNVSFAVRRAVLRLLDKAQSGVALPGLTGIRWAFFEELSPALWTTPTDQGNAAATDEAGVVEFAFPNTTLGAGDVGMLAATISDGNPAQSPVPRSLLIPVTLE